MSFLAKLTFDNDQGKDIGPTHNVLECSFEFNVGTDRRGKRTEKVRGGQISLLIESTTKEDFLAWIKDPKENRHGSITFYENDMMSSGKHLYFDTADCIHYSEEFNATSKFPMRTRLVIVPYLITVNGTYHYLWDEDKNNKPA